MNHIYSIVRLASTQQTQAVPENARQRRGGACGSSFNGVRAVVAMVALGAAGTVVAGSGPALGAAGSCQETGTFTVSDSRSPMCELTENDHVTITSTGRIENSNLPFDVNALQIGGPALPYLTPVNVRVVNHGVLYSTRFNGLRNYGVMELENTGLIHGLESGIANSGLITVLNNSSTGIIEGQGVNFSGIHNYGIITELNNAGTIRSYGQYGIQALNILGTLNNSGVITGPLGAISITDGSFNGQIGTINNSGQLLGSVFTANTTINLQGTSARISGALTNAGGSINLLGGADFTTESTFSSDLFNVNNGATLRVGNSAHSLTVSGAAANAFSNTGTLRVGEGVVANIIGNYSQSGAVRLGASSTANYGRVAVVGDAVLTPAATFVVDVNAVNSLANGQTFAGVVSATGSLTNSAPTNNVSDGSALFDFLSVTNGNAVDLQVVATGSPTPTPGAGVGIVSAAVESGIANAAPAATVLDGYVRGGATGTDWDAVTTALGRLPTNRDVAAAVGQIMPSLHGNSGLAGLAHGASSGAALEEQRATTGQSGGSEARSKSLWVKPVGNWFDQDAVDGVSGYKMDTYGLVGGIESDLNAVSKVGFGLGYLKSTVDGQDFAVSHRNTIESLQVIGYGRHALNATGLQFDWQGDYTRSSIDSQRVMNFIGRTAAADYNGDAWHLGVGLSQAYQVNKMTVRPLVALDWRQFKSEAYSETGAGALDLQVNSQKARELILKVGAQVQGDLTARTQWLTRAAVGYDLAGQRNGVTARFNGGGVAFTTDGLRQSRALAEVGVGVRYRASETMDVTARYDVRLRKGLRDQTASVRLGWAF